MQPTYTFANMRVDFEPAGYVTLPGVLPSAGDRMKLGDQWVTVDHIAWERGRDGYGGCLHKPTIHAHTAG